MFVCVVVCFGEEGLVVFVVVVWLCVLGKGGWDSLWFGGREMVVFVLWLCVLGIGGRKRGGGGGKEGGMP